MADDWQAGDLALCVTGPAEWVVMDGSEVDGPKSGAVLRVRWVGYMVGLYGPVHTLRFDEWPGDTEATSFASSEFRRVPPHTPDAEDAETIRLLRGAPVRVDA